MADTKIIRSALLPPYMHDTSTWGDLTDAIDAVFGSAIDDPTSWLAQLRDTWIKTQATDATLLGSSQLIASTGFETIEPNILIRQANMLGFDFVESSILSNDDYHRIVRNLSKYWYSKGTPQLANFFGFVLDSVITLTNLWSSAGVTPDTYGPFVAEADVVAGTEIWHGGAYFPTTHVDATIDPFKFTGVSLSKIVALFYSIANYNLVLRSVIFEGDVYFHSVDETVIARIVTATPMETIEIFETTF